MWGWNALEEGWEVKQMNLGRLSVDFGDTSRLSCNLLTHMLLCSTLSVDTDYELVRSNSVEVFQS